MMMWPAVTLLGFLVLTALVIAMGTQSTARYERERARERPPVRGTPSPSRWARVSRLIDRPTDRTPRPPPGASGARVGRRVLRASVGGVSSTVRSSDSSRSNRWCTARQLPAPEVAGRLPLALVEVASRALPVASACSSHSQATTRWPAASR